MGPLKTRAEGHGASKASAAGINKKLGGLPKTEKSSNTTNKKFLKYIEDRR